MLPVPKDAVACGSRRDLRKIYRKHAWVELGTDMRHRPNDGQYVEMFVIACIRCGRDEQLSADKVARLYVEATLRALVTGQDMLELLNDLVRAA